MHLKVDTVVEGTRERQRDSKREGEGERTDTWLQFNYMWLCGLRNVRLVWPDEGIFGSINMPHI